jgi:O-antigen/teichoic acid export membrane protein
MVIANFFMGAFQPYNFFLSAKGKGDYMLNVAIVLTFMTIAFNLLLIPLFKSHGAVLANIIALANNLVLHIYYYKLVKTKIK